MFGSGRIAREWNDSIVWMPTDNAYTRTFRRAVERVGDAERLAKAIGASVAEIEAWVAGHAHPPPSAFLKAIDVVAQSAWPPQGPLNT
jgi:hypothetical protein